MRYAQSNQSVFPAERYGQVFNGSFASVREENVDESPDEATECQRFGFRQQVENFFQKTNKEEGEIIKDEAEF